MLEFKGFPEEAIRFYEEIQFNNNKPWWDEQKPGFKKNVQTPAQQFVTTLGDRLRGIRPGLSFDTRLNGSGSIMRPYRDTRFSKDKTPYKTNLAMVWWEGDGKKTEVPCFYFHMSAESVWMGGGLYMFPKEVLDRYRRAVDHERLGPELEEAIAQLKENGFTPNGDMYKKVPRGYDKDHPRAELLKMKGMTSGGGQISNKTLMSPDLVDVCFEVCLGLMPMHDWLVKMMDLPETE